MKKILLLAGLFAATGAAAQMKEGRIVYDRIMQLQFNFRGNDDAQLPDLPKTRTEQYELLFANNQSLYQFLPSATADDGNYSANGMVVRFAGGGNNITYCNFNNGSRVDFREFMENEFLITDSIRSQNWKLSDETKTILNHPVRKATTQRVNTATRATMENGEMKRVEVVDTVQVVAWFATDIPVPVGPDMQGQLPGAILELDINKGRMVYRAIEISPKVAVNKIKAPAKGKKVNDAEYRAETLKLMDEMRKNMPGGSTIRVQQ